MSTDTDTIMADLKSEIKGLYEKSHKKNTELGEQIDVLKGKMATDADLVDIKNRIDSQNEEIEKVHGLLDAAEAKMAKRVPAKGQSFASLGEMMMKSGQFEDITTDKPGRWSHTIEAKDVTNLGNIQASPNRNVLVAEQDAGFLQPIDQPLNVRSLIPSGQTSSDTIQRTEEDVFTNNAGMVAEGGTKPQSEITFKRGRIGVEKIAHTFKASAEVLSDAAMLRSYIDFRGRYGVNFKEEQQLVNGNGTSPQLDGLLNTGNFQAYNNAYLSGVTPVDGVDDIRIAKQQAYSTSFIPATGVVMHPNDWAKLELLKDGDGNYLHSMATSGLTPRLWGMRVVESFAISEGNFHLGSFSMGAQIWDRWAMRVAMSTEDGNNFVENKVTFLFEKRLALEVYRPDAFVYGGFTGVTV